MKELNRIELLVQVAKLYYEYDYSQEMIAKKLELSRPYISKLLNEAKEKGIVQITVVDPLKTESALERKIREKYNLKRVIAVPETTEKTGMESVTKEAARYLDLLIKNDDIIGVAWGETIYKCSKELRKRTDIKNVTAVQLCGGISQFKKGIYANEIANNLAEAYDASSYLLPLPALVDDKSLKEALFNDNSIKAAQEFGEKSEIALFTMGGFGIRSALVQTGYLDVSEMEKLQVKGAVGDVCSHVIDINGNICDKSIDERTMAIPLESIKRKEERIGVALGASKVDCICGALNGGIINVLITNEETASWICERMSIS